MRLVLIFVFVLCACGGSAPPPPPRAVPVDIDTLQTGQVVDATEYLGRLLSRTNATLQPQVDGQVTQIFVEPGQVVEAGTPLMQIDPGRQPAAVNQARAERASRQAQLELAETNLVRVRKLVADEALPRQELDNALAAERTARADVEGTSAAIASNRVQLEFYKIVSPAHGVVGDIPVRTGDRVNQQTLLTTVTDNTVLEANVAIPIDRVRDLKLGLPTDILDADNHVIGEGVIDFISPLVNRETQSVLIKADIPNADGHLRADQVARVRVVWTTRQGVEVPALAITRVVGQAFVYAVQPSPTGLVAKQRPVTLGDLTNNAYVVTLPASLPASASSRRISRRSTMARRSRLRRHHRHPARPEGNPHVFSEFFIRRPVLSTVCSLLIVIGGAIAIPTLPIARYPELAAPQVIVSSLYIGANSDVVEAAVTTRLEESINGVEGMRYMQSSSTNDGLSTITVTFDPSRDIDLGAVDVQNRVQTALPRLPADVRSTGVTVTKSSTAIVLAAAFFSDHGEYSPEFISNYVDRYVRTGLERVPGVGEARIFNPRTFAMRLWLDPDKLATRGLSASDVVRALREQNLEIAAGQLGASPAPAGQALQISVRAEGRLPDVGAFERIIVQTGTTARSSRSRTSGESSSAPRTTAPCCASTAARRSAWGSSS